MVFFFCRLLDVGLWDVEFPVVEPVTATTDDAEDEDVHVEDKGGISTFGHKWLLPWTLKRRDEAAVTEFMLVSSDTTEWDENSCK